MNIELEIARESPMRLFLVKEDEEEFYTEHTQTIMVIIFDDIDIII